MGRERSLRQGSAVHRAIVAFDFDGTLTTKDSFTQFLAWRAGPLSFALAAAGLAPTGAAYLLRRDHGRMKAAAVAAFLAGRRREEIEASAVAFAESRARRLLRPDAVRVWKRWQTLGARLIICTASPEIVVAPFARGLGAEMLIGTRLALDEAGRFTGALDGENCRGAEKLRRLREALGDDFRLEAAYGDTSGDREMLAYAEEAGFRVFNGRP